MTAFCNPALSGPECAPPVEHARLVAQQSDVWCETTDRFFLVQNNTPALTREWGSHLYQSQDLSMKTSRNFISAVHREAAEPGATGHYTSDAPRISRSSMLQKDFAVSKGHVFNDLSGFRTFSRLAIVCDSSLLTIASIRGSRLNRKRDEQGITR